MNNILLITSSPRGAESLSTRLATTLAEGIQSRSGATLVRRDLVANPVSHITPAYVSGRGKSAADRACDEDTATTTAHHLVSELLAAEVVIIASGMINFGLPSQLKAWFDQIMIPGTTFEYTDAGPRGLLLGKTVYTVTAAGGIYSTGPYARFDFHENHLLHLLNFIGLAPRTQIRLEGTILGDEELTERIASAEKSVQDLLETMA